MTSKGIWFSCNSPMFLHQYGFPVNFINEPMQPCNEVYRDFIRFHSIARRTFWHELRNSRIQVVYSQYLTFSTRVIIGHTKLNNIEEPHGRRGLMRFSPKIQLHLNQILQNSINTRLHDIRSDWILHAHRFIGLQRQHVVMAYVGIYRRHISSDYHRVEFGRRARVWSVFQNTIVTRDYYRKYRAFYFQTTGPWIAKCISHHDYFYGENDLAWMRGKALKTVQSPGSLQCPLSAWSCVTQWPSISQHENDCR